MCLLDYTLRLFGGRHPLCGMGVMSFIKVISKPAAASARIEDSRPEPGPLTLTSTRFIPCSIAFLAQDSAVCCAANGVDFLEPGKVIPELAQATVFPLRSVIVTIVLLNVACMCAMPSGTFFRSRLRERKLFLLYIDVKCSVSSNVFL